MKKITLFIVLLSTINFYGQQKIAARVQQLTEVKTTFKKIVPLTVTNKANATVAANATFATLNERALQDIARNKYAYVELGIPYNGSIINVLLYRVEVLAKGFHVDTDKQANAVEVKGVYYRGIVKGDVKSIASFSFFEHEMSGIISAQGINNLVVGKLQKEGNLSDYIIYSDTQLTIPFNFECSVSDAGSLPGNSNQRNAQEALSERCVTVYFELDYDAFLDNGSDVETASNWIASVFNNVQTLYENDGINTALRSVYVWTEPDPYYGESSYEYLEQFYYTRPVFDGDVGQLITTNGGGLGGVAAAIGGLCSELNVSFSDVYYDFQEVPLFSWTVEVVVHELGHLYGSPHTHGCYWNGNNTPIDSCGTIAGQEEGQGCNVASLPENQGTIMSYCHLIDGVGISFANGFGPQPAARILGHVESSFCLSTDCVNTCFNTVTDFAISSTLTSATITWQDEGAGPWEVGYTAFNGTVTNFTQVAVNSVTFSGLAANTYYKFAVKPVCGNEIQSEAVEIIFATSANWCAGALFTDTGGTGGNYSNDQRVLRTITPPAGQAFRVRFDTFATEQDFDFLYVYDGPDTTYPLSGPYSGNNIPEFFDSTAPDGSLTFEFISDTFLTDSGWRATVECTLGLEKSMFANLRYYPNPTTGNVTITSAEGITGITVYNVAGQLLLNKAVNNTSTDADIASFANGVYFFKVTNGSKTAHFRIVKQ